MLDRANNVKLMPEIEKPCMQDLGKLCVENVAQDEVALFLYNNIYDFFFQTFSFPFCFCFFSIKKSFGNYQVIYLTNSCL